MISAIRRVQFAAGHRVFGHESKCATLHGHNYVVFFHATAENLDSVGRVIDFSVLKERLGGWIDENWDHTMLLYKEDRETIKNVMACERKKPIFVCDFNPTAENMANYLLRVVGPNVLNTTGVKLVKVAVWETENCVAEATL